MAAREDGTGEPSIFQRLRIEVANIVLGKVLWRWLRIRVPK